MPGQRPPLQRPDLGIVDRRFFSQQPRLLGFLGVEGGRQAGDGAERVEVEIDGIEKIAIAGVVGTGATAIPGEKHVQRIDADGGEARFARRRHDLPKRGEIADALVAFAAQAVKLGGDAACPGIETLGPPAGARRDGQMAKSRLIAVKRQTIAPNGQGRQGGAEITDGAAVASTFFRRRERAGTEFEIPVFAQLID